MSKHLHEYYYTPIKKYLKHVQFRETDLKRHFQTTHIKQNKITIQLTKNEMRYNQI